MNENEAWDYIVDNGIATESELRLVTDVAGFSVETLDAVVYSRTGEYLPDEEEDEEDEEDED